ncbi:MAG: BrnT family toxin [Bryobacteraceae bacterium]|nr:BrnT family toxin [Bryobacteraceae bacterium]
MRFEWDPAKNRVNKAKHDGLDFETAARVFDDPNLVLLPDRAIDGEQRWHAIGSVPAAVILVVHAYREENANGEEIIRIISARQASKRERRVYLQQTPD